MRRALLALCLLILASAVLAETERAKRTNCPNDCSGHGQCLGRECVCSQGWSGDDCSVSDTPVTLGQVVSDTLTQFQWKYYHVAIPQSGSGLSFSLTQTASGTDCDIYIQKDDFPTFSSYLARDISMNSQVTVNITNAGSGVWFAGVYGFACTPGNCQYRFSVSQISSCPNGCSGHGTCANSICTCSAGWAGNDCSQASTVLQNGVDTPGQVAQNSWNYFSFFAPVSARLDWVLRETGQASSEDCDLYIKYNAYPTLLLWDYSNDTKSSISEIIVPSTAQAGTWYAGVFGFTQCTYSLRVTSGSFSCNGCSGHGNCATSGTSCNCNSGFTGAFCETMTAGLQVDTPVNGFVSQSGWNYYHFTLNTVDPVVLSVTETGAGDCDLYVKEGAVPTRFDFDYFDIDTVDNFNLTIDEPGSSTWYIGLYGWQATTYTLTLEYKQTCDCSGHGECASGTEECVCDVGWGGDDCSFLVTSLISGVVATGAAATGNWSYYSLTTNGSSLAVITLRERSTTGYLWLYVSEQSLPTNLAHDYVSKVSNSAVQEIVISLNSPVSTTYYIGVYGDPFNVQGNSASFSLVGWFANGF